MNKRARNRLIGVTAIILIAVVAILLGAGGRDGAYYRSVDDVANDPELAGERVKLGGTVVAGSWNKQSNPMVFEIRDEADEAGTGPTIQVVYNGGVPSTFGDGVVAIITGDVTEDGAIDSDDMITKCPSKYETATGSLTVTQALEQDEGSTFPVSGYVVAGSVQPPGGESRFAVETEDGADTIAIVWEGALPAGIEDGSMVVVQGSLEGGAIIATDVSLADTEK